MVVVVVVAAVVVVVVYVFQIRLIDFNEVDLLTSIIFTI